MLLIVLSSPSYGQWKHDYFMDASTNKTKNDFVITTVDAVFSNSVTKNAKMSASVLVSGTGKNIAVTFKMSQNNLSPTVRLGTLKVSVPVGDKPQKFTAYKGVLTGKKAGKFIDLLKQGSKLAITAINQQQNGLTSTYLFSLETQNFVEELNKLGS
jgi:hypothetical protein